MHKINVLHLICNVLQIYSLIPSVLLNHSKSHMQEENCDRSPEHCLTHVEAHGGLYHMDHFQDLQGHHHPISYSNLSLSGIHLSFPSRTLSWRTPQWSWQWPRKSQWLFSISIMIVWIWQHLKHRFNKKVTVFKPFRCYFTTLFPNPKNEKDGRQRNLAINQLYKQRCTQNWIIPSSKLCNSHNRRKWLKGREAKNCMHRYENVPKWSHQVNKMSFETQS